MAGGNSYFTAGATRIGTVGSTSSSTSSTRRTSCAHGGAALQPRGVSRRPEQGHRRSHRPRAGRRVLVTEAQDAVRWLHSLGLRYRLMYERQAYERPDGSYLFWGGLTRRATSTAAKGSSPTTPAAAAKLGIEIRYGTRAGRAGGRGRSGGRRAIRRRGGRRRASRRQRDHRVGRVRVQSRVARASTSATAGATRRCAEPRTTPAR